MQNKIRKMKYIENLSFEQKQIYYSALCEMISPERVSLFEKVIEERTDMQCVVVENIYQSQNASAVLRTCDCVGIQQVHVIENNNAYQINDKNVYENIGMMLVTFF